MSELNWYECSYQKHIRKILAPCESDAAIYMVFLLRTRANANLSYDDALNVNVRSVEPSGCLQERRWFMEWLEFANYDSFAMMTIIKFQARRRQDQKRLDAFAKRMAFRDWEQNTGISWE
ncbi:MAG: hypothetical protein GTO60_16600 [Gammaproteobacteria bacterium]|nr:hypothetical protein [Gammaproteobacteria bacterium]